MTDDEQEALSRRHDSSAIVILLRLASGRFAVYNNARELCTIIDSDMLAYAVEWSGASGVQRWPPAEWRPPAEAPSQPTINLKELGLE